MAAADPAKLDDQEDPMAEAATLTKPISEIADRLGLPAAAVELYGRSKAKIAPLLAGTAGKPAGKLVLVTAMTPTPAGEGKTTTAIGLDDALIRLGKKSIVVLREPSLGPVFGMKGGATGGGKGQGRPQRGHQPPFHRRHPRRHHRP